MTDAGDPQQGHEHEHEPVGDLGEEAAKLLGVLAGWTAAVDEHVATGAPECQWCPVCRVVHVVRTTPELRGHLTTAASALLKAAAAVMATPSGEQGAAPREDPPSDDLEHIDLDAPDDRTDPGHDTGTEEDR